tara:strand:- start:45 stop:506 length:462 start_codon:yes stop_codon:yes gene_type:complete
MSSTKTKLKTEGSIALGVLAGAILLVIIGWIPLIGGLIAGFVAGAVARGAGRGFIAGLLAGSIGAIILAVVLTSMVSLVGELLGLATLGGLLDAGAGAIIAVLSVGGAIVCAIGGLIGGTLRGRKTIIIQQPGPVIIQQSTTTPTTFCPHCGS